MKQPTTTRLRSVLNRRTFLRSGGACIALPFLNAMLPRGMRAEERAMIATPKRLVLVARNLGLHAPWFFPTKTGLDYEATRYLKLLEEHRGSFTVFSGMSHLGYHSHHCEKALFTGVDWDRIKNPSDIHNSISLDQLAARHLGGDTRIPSLILGHSENQLSWTDKGVPLPPERYPEETFRELFLDAPPEKVRREIRRLTHGQSILDDMREQSKALSKSLGQEDRERIDLLFTSIREAEEALLRNQAWAGRPKPKVDFKMPQPVPHLADVAAHEGIWFDLVRLALQTDSTRVVLLTLTEVGHAKIDGFTGSTHHDVSHHGKDPSKIEQLTIIEEAEIKQLNRFLSTLKQSREGSATLFDQTVVISASNLGNASAHTGDNLPILMAGGGFKHQGHIAFDTVNNTPLSNLYLRALHQLGIEAESFGSSTGVIDEV